MNDKVKTMLEKAKFTAGVAVEAAGKAADAAGKKAGEVFESTKKNLKVFDLTAEIDIAYKEIGKLVYRAHTGEETSEEEMQGLLASVDEKLAQIEDIKQKAEQEKKAKETVECVNCGGECGKADEYCKACGAKL